MTWIGIEDIPFKDRGMTQEKMDLLKELAEDSEYWASALHFIDSIRNRKYSSLTKKQQDWLFDIFVSLEVELNHNTAEGLFGNTEPLSEESMKELFGTFKPRSSE